MATTDRELVAAALEKRRAGQTPTRAEARALARFQREAQAQQRRDALAACPKKLYCELSGRQVKVLNEQAARYGIPCGSATVDLGAVVRWLHDFLARNKTLLSGASEDPLLAGASQQLKDDYVRAQVAEKREKARLAQLDRLEREGRLLDAAAVHRLTSQLATILRAKSEALQRLYGPGAVKILNEGLDDAQGEIDRYFAAALDDDDTDIDAGRQPNDP